MFLNAGLTHDHVEVICAALHLVHEDELVQVFLICNELQTILLNLLLEEMFSTRADMVYWERFRKGSNWEILLSRMNSRVFNWVFPREDNIESLFQNPTDLIHYIESLRADFYSLAIFLAKVNHAGSYLKKIYNEIHKKSVFRHPTCATLVLAAKVLTVSTNQSCAPAASASRVDGERDHVNESNEELLTFSQKTVKDVVTQTHKLLREFLTEISQAIGDHMPQLSLFEQLPRCEKQELQQASISTLHIVSGTMMDMLLRHPCYDTGFPLGITHLKVRRPSYMERYWIRNILASVAGFYIANTTIRMIRTGELQDKFSRLVVFVQGKIQEHVVEPVSDLALELFDTIRKREDIVSRNDLEASRASLNRMLVEFSQSKEGSALILNRLTEELLKRGDNLLESIKNTGSAAVGGSALPSTGNEGAKLAGNVAESFQATPEQAWAVLMSEYEKELQTPIRGILYGNLFTAMLIQMQKLKVHTEAAMLTMDQILASNELTIAATAAMPALVAFGLSLSWLRGMLRPKAQTPGVHTLHFRLILSDVERSLLAWQSRAEEHAKEMQALSTRQHSQLLSRTESTESDIASVKAEAEARRFAVEARGVFSFHMARLRSKFQEMFDLRSPNAELRVIRRGLFGGEIMMRHTGIGHVVMVPLHPVVEGTSHAEHGDAVNTNDSVKSLPSKRHDEKALTTSAMSDSESGHLTTPPIERNGKHPDDQNMSEVDTLEPTGVTAPVSTSSPDDIHVALPMHGTLLHPRRSPQLTQFLRQTAALPSHVGRGVGVTNKFRARSGRKVHWHRPRWAHTFPSYAQGFLQSPLPVGPPNDKSEPPYLPNLPFTMFHNPLHQPPLSLAPGTQPHLYSSAGDAMCANSGLHRNGGGNAGHAEDHHRVHNNNTNININTNTSLHNNHHPHSPHHELQVHPPTRSWTEFVLMVWKQSRGYVYRGHRLCIFFLHSLEDFVVSTHWLLLGNNRDYFSNTNVYNSLEADLLLLESPEEEVSIRRKLDIIQSMRTSYKCLSPLN